MKHASFLGLVFAATMASGLAYAEDGPHERGMHRAGFMQERFADLDTNGDGRVTRAEAEARAAADFADADTDGDGALSEEEATAFHQTRHAERMALHEERRAERHEERGGRHFERAAGDDGIIDADEFAAHGLHRFEMADLDENGEVTETEMELVASFMERRHGRHHGRHGEHSDRWGEDD